jgi:hypothetical protein
MNSIWQSIGAAVLNKQKSLNFTEFRRYYKLCPSLVSVLYNKLRKSFDFSANHLMWTLHYLKSANPDDAQIATLLGTNKNTLRKNVKKILSMILCCLPKFNFFDRFKNWRYIQPSCLVDSTFVMIQKPYLSPWEYYSKEKKCHGLFYQVTCSLGKPFRFLSFDGPFKGAAADVSIARSTIIPLLKEKEKVMCDKGYWQDNKCWCPPLGDIDKMATEDKIKRRKVTRIRHLNERLIGRLVSWGCFKKKWRYSWSLHEMCAHAAARLTQLQVYAFPLT